MNTSSTEATALACAVAAGPIDGVEVVVCPPFPWLLAVRDSIAGSGVALGAQDCWPKPNGAFTGAVSISMVRELADYVIIGHSERRTVFGETDELVAEKISAALEVGLIPIVCVGESLDTRESGSAEAFVSKQIVAAFEGRTPSEIISCVVAYEPIWAIGTGVAATPRDAESMAKSIRGALAGFDHTVASGIRVLYGGSVTPSNAAETLRQPNVDGALVGGASLNAAGFLQIVQSISH
jgi:triosephosphate isomerase